MLPGKAIPAAGLLVTLVAAATEPSSTPVVRQDRRFDIRFLTEHIPDFVEFREEYHTGLLLHPPDDCGDGTCVLGEETSRSTYGTVAAFLSPIGAQCAFAEEESAFAAPWTRIDPDALVELIKTNIAEDSWASSRNAIRADEQTLSVRQTPDVLDRIEALLAQLRSRRGRMIAVDLALVPAAALGPLSADAAPWLASEEYDAIVARAGGEATVLSLAAYDGQTVSAHTGDRRITIVDFDINQTGVWPVVNAWVQQLRLGVVAVMRPRSIGTTDWILLSLRIRRRSIDGEPKKLVGPFGEYETARLAETRLVTDLIVRAGGGAVVGLVEGTAEGVLPLAALVRARPFSLTGVAPRAEEATEEFVTRMYDIEFILRCAGVNVDPLAHLPGNPEDLETYVCQTIAAESWQDARTRIEANTTRLLVCNRLAVHERIEAQLDAWMRDGAALATVETWSLAGTNAQLEALLAWCGADGRLPADWETRARAAGLTVTTRVLQHGLLGKPIQCDARTSQNYVATYECISGGATGFTLSAVPDPIVRSAGSGFDLTWAARPLPAKTARVDFSVAMARTLFGRTAVFHAPWRLTKSSVVRPEASGALRNADQNAAVNEEGDQDSPIPSATESIVYVPVTIDLPEQHAWRLRRDLLVPWEEPVLVEARMGEADVHAAGARIVRLKLWPAMGR